MLALSFILNWYLIGLLGIAIGTIADILKDKKLELTLEDIIGYIFIGFLGLFVFIGIIVGLAKTKIVNINIEE